MNYENAESGMSVILLGSPLLHQGSDPLQIGDASFGGQVSLICRPPRFASPCVERPISCGPRGMCGLPCIQESAHSTCRYRIVDTASSPRIDPRQLLRRDRLSRASAAPLRNTPPVARANVRLFAELFGDPQANAARWFVASMVLGGIVALQAIAIFRMLPLKQVVPYAVQHSAEGAIVKVVEAAAYQPGVGVIKSELARWVERLMVIDPYLTRDNLRVSVRPLRGKAVSQHKAFVDSEAPFKRLLATPGLVRTAHTHGVDVSQQGIAFVFVTGDRQLRLSLPSARK